jgi:PAS domain S-box-containing protein
MALQSYEENIRFSARDVEILEFVSGQAAVAIDRKQAESDLVHQRELMRALMDNSPDYIYFKDLESRFIQCSRAMCRRFEADVADFIGKCDADFYADEHSAAALKDEQEIIRTGNPVIGKIEREGWKNGRETWVLTSKIPLRNKANEIIGTFGVSKDITAIKEAEAKLEEVHRQLLETSRLAGMAEVATSVLHNVGNVLNSVNISSSLVAQKVRNSKVGNLAKAVALIQEHAGDLPAFFNQDPRGQQLPSYLVTLSERLVGEQKEILQEVASLGSNIEHIKEIVSMQQSYAKVSGVMEVLPVADLVEDALRMNAGAMERHHVQVIRDYSEVPAILVDKHKVLQVLVNLIRNAKYALDENGQKDKQMTLKVGMNGNGMVKVAVHDNGVGIPGENLTRIFEHGFTTRKEGHGFGLHSGALAAREMGGSLNVHSDGPGHGATFTLELPFQTIHQDKKS